MPHHTLPRASGVFCIGVGCALYGSSRRRAELRPLARSLLRATATSTVSFDLSAGGYVSAVNEATRTLQVCKRGLADALRQVQVWFQNLRQHDQRLQSDPTMKYVLRGGARDDSRFTVKSRHSARLRLRSGWRLLDHRCPSQDGRGLQPMAPASN